MRIGGFNERPRRIAFRQPAILINSDGVENDVFIFDLSSNGFRLQVTDLLRVDELVTLRVEREDFPAKIVWILGDEAGGVFMSPVDQFEWEDTKEGRDETSRRESGGRSPDRRAPRR